MESMTLTKTWIKLLRYVKHLSLYKDDYLQILKCVSFWLHKCFRRGKVGHINWLISPVRWLLLLQFGNHKSARNLCEIECFGGIVLFMKFLLAWLLSKHLDNYTFSLMPKDCYCCSKTETRVWCVLLIYQIPTWSIHLGIEFYLFVSHGGMKRQRVYV